jgi:hypothetical protein
VYEEVVIADMAVLGVDAAIVFDGLLHLKGVKSRFQTEEKAQCLISRQ